MSICNNITNCKNCSGYIYPSDNEEIDDEDYINSKFHIQLQKQYGSILEYLCMLCQHKLMCSIYENYKKESEEVIKYKNYFA